MWCRHLGDGATTQHGDQIGNGEGLVLVVGDQDGRGPVLTQDLLDVGPHRRPHVGIEGGERLVQQEQPGHEGQRPGQGHPLLLSPRELVRVALGQAVQTGGIEELVHTLSRPLAPRQAEAHVFSDVEMGEEAAFLRDVADVATLGGLVVLAVVDDFATDGDGPPVRSFESGENAEKGGLPASGRTEHGRDGSGRHLEIEPLEHRLWSETLGETGNDQVGGGRFHAGLVA